MSEPLRPRNEGPQAAVGRAVTRKSHVGAQVTVPGKAERTAATRNRRIEHDSLAAAGTARDDACEFVAENERPVELRVADSPLEEPVAVGAAEADAADAHEHLPRLRLRIRFLV
jgi:hypothetical protein